MVQYYTIQETKDHGKAMIATMDINPGPHGITVLKEKALLITPPTGSENDKSGPIPSILSNFDPQIWTDWWNFQLQTEEHQNYILNTMYYEMDCDHAVCLKNFLKEKRQLLADGKLPDPELCKTILDYSTKFVQYTMVVRFNSVHLHPPNDDGTGPGIYYGHGIFLDACKMSHSCKPNCVWHSSLDGTSKIVRAIMPIAKGQELTIDYIGGELEPVVYRRKELYDSKGFLCECTRCGTLPKSAKTSTSTTEQTSTNVSLPTSPGEGNVNTSSPVWLQHDQQRQREEETKKEYDFRGDDTRRFRCITTTQNGANKLWGQENMCFGVHFLVQPLETIVAALTNCSHCGAVANDEYVRQVMDMEMSIYDEINELRETIETTNDNVDERIENLQPPHPLHCLAAQCYKLRGEHYSRKNQHVLAAKEYAKQVACRIAILGDEYYSEGTAWCMERMGDELIHVNVDEAEIAYKRSMRSLHMTRGHPREDPYVNCVIRKVSNLQNRKLDIIDAPDSSDDDSLPYYVGVTNIALSKLNSDGTGGTLEPICQKEDEVPCHLCGNVSKLHVRCDGCSHIGQYCCRDHLDLHWSLVHEKHCPKHSNSDCDDENFPTKQPLEEEKEQDYQIILEGGLWA